MAWAWSWLEKKVEPAVLTFTTVLWPLMTGVSIEGVLACVKALYSTGITGGVGGTWKQSFRTHRV